MINPCQSCQCGSNNIEYFTDSTEGFTQVKCKCNDCGILFTDLYQITYLGRTYKPELKISNIVEFKSKRGN